MDWKKKIMKLALKIIAGLFALVIVALIGFLMTFDVNQYKDDIVKIVQEKTQRTFSIEGELRLEPSLIPTVAVEGVKFGNAKWGSKPDMLSVGLFEAQVALLPLLSKNIQVKRLILNDAHILLEKNKKGEANWTIELADAKPGKKKEQAEAPAAATALPGLDINEVRIKNATLTYIDAVTSKTEKVSLNELSIEAGGYTDPLEVLLDANYNNMPVKLTGSGGSLHSLVNNEPYELNISSKIGKIKADLGGKVADPKQFKGLDLNVEISMSSLQEVAVLIKKELPDVGPIDIKANVTDKGDGYELKSLVANIDKLMMNANGEIANAAALKGLKLNFDVKVDKLSDLNKLAQSKLPEIGPFALGGTATDSDGGYKLTGFKLKLDQTDINGVATINLSGTRPSLAATTSSSLIDLTLFIAKEEKKKTEKKSKVFSAEPLPFDLLKKADVNASVSAKKIQHPDMPLENVELKLSLNNGNLGIKPFKFNAAGGVATANVSLDASSGKTGKLVTSIDIKNFEPSTLPTLQGKLKGGKTDINIDINGNGKSVAEIMAGLNGKFLVQMGAGTLKSGKDGEEKSLLLSTFNSVYGSASKDETILQCGVINANIVDGIATLDKGVAFQTRAMNLIGSGAINLKTEELDIGIDPEAREGMGLGVGQLAELVRVRGTLAEPKAGPSTKEALKSAATIGAAVATGGISILAQGLFNRATADADPCATALGMKPMNTTQQQAEPEPTKTAPTEESDKDPARALGDKLKGLFN